MNKTVFILGAGTSVCSGAPIISNFLKEARELYYQGIDESSHEDFETVFQIISEFQEVLIKSTVDLDDIEVILAALEIGQVIGAMNDRIDYERVIPIFKRFILKTLELKIKYDFNSEHRFVLSQGYEQFVSLIRTLMQYKKQGISIISFNYDINIDIALRYRNMIPIYFLKDSESSNHTTSIPLLKLHGSLNWTKCECGEINYFDVADILQARFSDTGSHGINLMDFLRKVSCSKCFALSPKHEPVIIPPIFNKINQQRELQLVWRQAANELSEAENIIVIGYSLRESDYFFKYLFALGAASKTRIEKFIVVNPDGGVCNNFRKLISKDVENKLIDIGGRFEDCKDILIEKFEVFKKHT